MIVLDTCALVWLVDSPAELSDNAIEAIRKNSGSTAVLPISAWEIALKVRNGGILMRHSMSPYEWYREVLEDYGLVEIPLDAKILCASAKLEFIHRDPCDRMIIAAAIEHRSPVVTADQTFRKYPGLKVIW